MERESSTPGPILLKYPLWGPLEFDGAEGLVETNILLWQLANRQVEYVRLHWAVTNIYDLNQPPEQATVTIYKAVRLPEESRHRGSEWRLYGWFPLSKMSGDGPIALEANGEPKFWAIRSVSSHSGEIWPERT